MGRFEIGPSPHVDNPFSVMVGDIILAWRETRGVEPVREVLAVEPLPRDESWELNSVEDRGGQLTAVFLRRSATGINNSVTTTRKLPDQYRGKHLSKIADEFKWTLSDGTKSLVMQWVRAGLERSERDRSGDEERYKFIVR